MLTITGTLQGFIDYMTTERACRPRTIQNYRESTTFFVKQMGDMPVADITLHHFISFKARMAERGAHESRIAHILTAMKNLLRYAKDVLNVPIMDLSAVTVPRPPRREVIYLEADELDRFIEAIRLRTWSGSPRLSSYCFRALVEVLLATGMRISEALSLNRDSINTEKREAVIIGKGNEQRTVFFTERALQWLFRYTDLRNDSSTPLFATTAGGRLSINTVEHVFRRVGRWAGLDKRVTPHMLRHTMATNLLRNGCPIGYIKELLGHHQLETTCRYYLGILSKADTKRAHEIYSTAGQSGPNLPLARPTIADSSSQISRGGAPGFPGPLPWP